MAAGAVDIHTHVVPASFPAYAGRHANVRWPQMAPGHDCRHCNVMIAGKVFRTVTDECWSIGRRLEAMAASRVERQVLSPMPELLSYWLEPEDAEALGGTSTTRSPPWWATVAAASPAWAWCRFRIRNGRHARSSA